MSASQVSSHGEERSSTRQIYFGKEILPDHLFYPALMAADKIVMELADEKEAVYLKVQYSIDRFEVAERLLEKQDIERSVTALTKSQKYLLSAAHDVIYLELDSEVKTHVLAALKYQTYRSEELSTKLPASEAAVVMQLVEESRAIIPKLEEHN
ncbi:MAG: hypothetical protein WAU07_04440 [Microgenomates group bacterium]